MLFDFGLYCSIEICTGAKAIKLIKWKLESEGDLFTYFLFVEFMDVGISRDVFVLCLRDNFFN